MIQSPVYMDYHATTPVDSKVLEAMLPYFSNNFGNPASRQHKIGWMVEEAVESSRKKIAGLIGSESKEIIFTSSSTESNNLGIKGIADAYKAKGNHIITVKTEHKSVVDSCKRLEKQGYAITYLEVNEGGFIDLQKLEEAITEKTILVSVMLANNEIGVIQPLAEIGKICHSTGVFFHTDATQGMAYNQVNVNSLNVDLMSFNAHKIYGPKGVGALYIKTTTPRIRLTPQMDGGGHERDLRSGTLNVPGIVGLATALEICNQTRSVESIRLSGFRNQMLDTFTRELEKVYVNGSMNNRLPNNLNISFLDVDHNTLIMSMKDVAISTGSACSTGAPTPSYVLKALGLSSERLHTAVRFGLGRYTTDEEVTFVIQRVIEHVTKIRQFSSNYKTKAEQFA